MRSVTILNEAGDQTITWTPDRDAAMAEIIKKKMEQGIAFYVVDPLKPDLKRRPKLKDAAEAAKHRALSIKDKDFAAFVSSGSGDVIATPQGERTGARRSKDAAEIASGQSVGVKPRRGG